jgi:hypothetical protein
LKISRPLALPSTGVAFVSSPFTAFWASSASSVSPATESTIFPLSSSAFLISPTISVPSVFPSISVLSASPITLLLSSSPGIQLKSKFPANQVTVVHFASLAFLFNPFHNPFLDILSSSKIIIISDYPESFSFLFYQTTLVHTSYHGLIVFLSIPVLSASHVSFAFPVSSTILGNYLFGACHSSQLYPAKDVHVERLKIPFFTSIAGSYDIACFVVMDRWEEDMGVMIEYLAGDLDITKASECPEQPPLDTLELCGGAPVSGNGLQSISNWTLPANELCRHPLVRPGLNRKLHLGTGNEILYFGSCTSESFTSMDCKILWNTKVAGPDSIGDMVQSFMNRVNYDSVSFIERTREQLVKVYDRFGYRKLFDDSTAQLLAEIQVLAPPALPLFERSPIYSDTRLFRVLLSGRLNTEFRNAFLDNPEIIKMPDLFSRRALSGYISQTEDRPDENIIKLVSINGPLNLALQKAIYGTFNDLVNYTNFVDTTIDDLERLPKTLTISSWMDEMDILKYNYRNVSIIEKPDGTLSIDSLRGTQRLLDGFSRILSR